MAKGTAKGPMTKNLREEKKELHTGEETHIRYKEGPQTTHRNWTSQGLLHTPKRKEKANRRSNLWHGCMGQRLVSAERDKQHIQDVTHKIRVWLLQSGILDTHVEKRWGLQTPELQEIEWNSGPSEPMPEWAQNGGICRPDYLDRIMDWRYLYTSQPTSIVNSITK